MTSRLLAATTTAPYNTSWNTTSDTISPVVAIASPADGGSYSGGISIQAKATDNIGVTKIALYIDGKLTQSSTSSMLNAVRRLKPKGSHIILVRAYDTAGNTGEKIITVIGR